MNYLMEIKAFYDRLETNPLPSPSIALWHALMYIANKTGWQEEFAVALSVLVLRSGLNETAVKRARNKLMQEGYITWRSRGGNQAAVYKMISLVVQNKVKNDPQSDPQSAPQCDPQSDPQSAPINKQNKTKQKGYTRTQGRNQFNNYQQSTSDQTVSEFEDLFMREANGG